MKAPYRLLSVLLVVLFLWSCGDDSTSPSVDDTNPTLAIEQPTSAGEHLTSASPVEVSGTATDDSGVDRVEWSIAGGASGTAEGTTSWTIPAIELSEGENALTVTAFDTHDNAAGATLTLILDQTAPVVALSEPVDADGEYTTVQASVAVTGTASDTGGLDRIDWAIEGGTSGTASGTETWQIDVLPLEHGPNQVTITALDLAGNISIATFTAKRTQALGSMAMDPSVILTNSTRQIRVTLALDPVLDMGGNGVRLVEVDRAGTVVEELATLEDNGNLDQGDDILGDGVYSALLTISRSAPQDLRLQVLAEVGGGATPEARSPVRILSINTPTSATDDQLLLDVQHDAADSLNTMLAQGTDLATAVQSLAQQIADQDGVASVETQGETSVAITYDSGLLGGLILALDGGSGTGVTRGGTWTGTQPGEWISPPRWDARTAAPTAVAPNHFFRTAADTIRRARGPGVPLSQQTRGSTAPAAAQLTETFASAATSGGAILNRKVLIYAPYEAVWDPYNEGPDLVTILDASVLDFDVTYLSNQEATVEALTRLTDYGLVVLATHGSAGRHFLTGEIATDERREAYDAERQAGQIVVWTMIEIGEDEDESSIREDVFGVTDTFVDALPGAFPQSLIVNNSCESTLREDLADAFLAKGAETYTGFSAIVTSAFAVDMVLDLIDPMVDSGLEEVGSAFTEGQIDPHGSWSAEFELRGNEELGYSVEFTSGGFESGSLGGWTADGDGRVITRLGTEDPVEGQFMGIISTGLGFTTNSGAIYQTFAVPEDAQGIRVHWNFISEEFLEWIGTEYQDNFQVSVIQPDQPAEALFSRTVDDIADEFNCTDTGGPDCSLIPVSPGIVFDEGDVYMTGWQTLELDLTPYRGEIITLGFSARDVGDSDYDTAILLDGMVLY